MNIIPINGVNKQINIYPANSSYAISNYAAKPVLTYSGKLGTLPLTHDIVCFTGTPKALKNRTEGITLQLAKQIHEIAAKDQLQVENYMNNLLGELFVTSYNKGNIITEIAGRAKTANSISEKAATRRWQNKKEILDNMTDLNGIKIILRDGSREGVNAVLNKFIKEIENGNLELLEIENKRPEIAKQEELLAYKAKKSKKAKAFEVTKYDYAEPAMLEKMVDTAESKYPEKSVNYIPADYTKMNYPALHFLFKLPNMQRCFEVQLMGRDVALYKELDDIIYKILNNKNVDKKYKPLVDIIEPLNEPGNASIKESFNKYRANVFAHQRKKAPHIRGNEPYTEYFLPISDEIEDGDLRRLLDINNLYRTKLECEMNSKRKH